MVNQAVILIYYSLFIIHFWLGRVMFELKELRNFKGFNFVFYRHVIKLFAL